MNKETFFFDTYAFFEIFRGNPNYKKYEDALVITSIFNVAELNYNLKKEKGKEISNSYTKKFMPFVVEITFEDIKRAMDLKVKNKKLSIPDVIGYIVAKRHKVKFLTGDEGFKYMKNVEFVK